MTLRIGLIGAGANTKLKHIPGFQKIDEVDLVTVCNRSRESAQKVADEFGIPDISTDWREVVHRDDVDAVCIGTWPYLHCEVTIEALTADKHVLTEARMAMNLDEAREMYQVSKSVNKVAMIVPAQLHPESEKTTIDMIADGVFGEWLEICVNAVGGGYDPNAPLHWRQRRILSGNNIMHMGIFNENVHRYAGFEKSLIAHDTSFTTQRMNAETGQLEDADVPESVGIVAEMQSGATAVYHISSVARFGGRGADLELHGTKGALKIEDGLVWVASEGDSDFHKIEIPEEKRGRWRVEEEFVDAIQTGSPVTHTNFSDGVKYMEFTEAVHISLKEGRRVSFPL